MDLILQACIDELDEIEKVSMSHEDKKKWSRRAGTAAGVATGVAGAAILGRRGVKFVADELADGMRRGVREGMDAGIANLKKSAPGIADDAFTQIRPQLNEAADDAADAAVKRFKSSLRRPWRS